MIGQIEEWILQVNAEHEDMQQNCSAFQEQFDGFYSEDLLKSAHFVVTEKIPKPDFHELREAGLGTFLDMKVRGVTYNDTYYVEKNSVNDLVLHFHELVHIVQWRELGPQGFISRYLQEIQTFGYDNAPLENMAYALDENFREKGPKFFIERFVRENL